MIAVFLSVALAQAQSAEGTRGLQLEYGDPGIVATSRHFDGLVYLYGHTGTDVYLNPSDNLANTWPRPSSLADVDILARATFFGRWVFLYEGLTVASVNSGYPELSPPWQHRWWTAVDVAPWLRIKAGAGHMPATWWMRQYHHGQWLMPTVTRPYMARFEEDGILSVHLTGLELSGRVGGGASTVLYILGVGQPSPLPRPNFTEVTLGGTTEGTHHRLRSADDAVWQDDPDRPDLIDLGFTGMLAVEFSAPSRPRVGIGGYWMGLSPSSTSATNGILHRVGTLHATWSPRDWELVAETALIWNTAQETLDDHISHSAYLFATRHFGDWSPYGRLDYRQMALGDPYYAEVFSDQAGSNDSRDLDRHSATLGLRWDATRFLALTGEVSGGQQELRDDNDALEGVPSGSGHLELAVIF